MSDLDLYDQPAATAEERHRAERLLREQHRVSVDDRSGHRGALQLLRDRVRSLGLPQPSQRRLLPAVRQSCDVPGLTLGDVLLSSDKPRWEWIDPRRIVHDELGMPFEPYHYSYKGLAGMAARIVAENAAPHGLLELFGGPVDQWTGIVVSRVGGPLGPVHIVTVNGLHRTAVLRALKLPAVVAEVHDMIPPFRVVVRDKQTEDEMLAFLRWLDAAGAIRLGRRPIVTTRYQRYVRVVQADAPFLLCPPARALAAVDAYEAIVGERVTHFGPLDVVSLRAAWHHARHHKAARYGADVIAVSVDPSTPQ